MAEPDIGGHWLSIPEQARAFVMQALSRFSGDFPDIRLQVEEDRVRISGLAPEDVPQVSAAWPAALLGELLFERSTAFRTDVHERLFGR